MSECINGEPSGGLTPVDCPGATVESELGTSSRPAPAILDFAAVCTCPDRSINSCKVGTSARVGASGQDEWIGWGMYIGIDHTDSRGSSNSWPVIASCTQIPDDDSR